MICSFRDAEAEKLFRDEFSRKYQSIEHSARRRLLTLAAAEKLQDLAAVPGNNLEALKGDRKGQDSIRINQRYRVCFVWTDSGAAEVEIVDYH